MASGAGLRLVVKPAAVEAALWRRFRFGERTGREDLFKQYLALARAVAAQEHRRRPAYGLEKADFEQLAYAGLLEAIDRFDPLRGAPFEAFARHRIRGAIADGAAKSSESGAQYSFRRRLETERLRALRQGQALADPVAELTALSVGLALGLIAESAGSLNSAAGTSGVSYESAAWNELQLWVLEEIEALPEAERTLIKAHYIDGVSFAQIAELLHLSKGRISQLNKSALQRLRERLRGRSQR